MLGGRATEQGGRREREQLRAREKCLGVGGGVA